MKRTQRARWPVGSYASVSNHEAFAEQMTHVGLDCAAVARRVNALFGTTSKRQVVSRQFVSRLRSGQTKRCTPHLAQSIATVLGVVPSALFTMHEVPKSPRRRAQKTAHRRAEPRVAA